MLKIHSVNEAVISIGNITTGGTGKTPLAIWVCRYLQNQNLRCAIILRGYQTKKGKFSDEPAILAKSCPEAKVIVKPDRVASATEAVNRFGAEAIVMDDGFQHRRLARDIDIVTIDSTLPFGYGKLLPAGLLREPLSALKRASAVVITRCDQVNESKLAELEERLRLENPTIRIGRTVHKAICARAIGGEEITLDELKSKKIFAFCGIGNPNGFLGTVNKLGVEFLASKIFNDHHHYTKNDIKDICEEARYFDVNLILSTQKDWVKTTLLMPESEKFVFAYLDVELQFISGQEKITLLIKEALAGKIQ